MSSQLVRAAAVAGLAAAVVAAPVPALAARAHHGKHPRVVTHRHTHRTAKAQLHGLVVSRQGDQLVVLAHTAKIGRRAVHNKVEQVTLAATARAARHVQAGYLISATGRADGSDIVNAVVQASSPRPAEVVIGTVEAVNGDLVSICALDATDGSDIGSDNGDQSGDATDTSGDQNGDQVGCAGEDSQGDGLTADVTAAAFSGAASSAGDLTSGQYIIALGERSGGLFTAADLVVYTREPAFVVGRVMAADQSSNSLAIAARDGDGSGETDGSAVAVDTTNALITVNGTQGATFPAVGDQALVVGPDGSAATAPSSTPLAASLVYDFNGNDEQPVDDNGGDGGSGD